MKTSYSKFSVVTDDGFILIGEISDIDDAITLAENFNPLDHPEGSVGREAKKLFITQETSIEPHWERKL